MPTTQLGLHAYLKAPLRAALARGRTVAVQPGQDIPVVTRITGSALRNFVHSLAPQVRVEPVDARFRLVKNAPVVVPDQWGRQLDTLAATAAIAAALRQPDRGPVVLPTKVVKPAVTQRLLPPALVVDRTLHHVTLYRKHGKAVRTLGVAVGQSQYPTPVGRFEIIEKQLNPWWYPPNSAWAAGEKPVPPGPGNPLGTRWMGLSAPGVGLHGTPDAASVGYSASHGCIRMRIPDAEWLFVHVRVGSPCGSSTRRAAAATRRGGMTDHPCCETRALSLRDRAAARARRAVRLAARPPRRQRVPRRPARRAPAARRPRSRCRGSTARARSR